jgi:glutaredoxin
MQLILYSKPGCHLCEGLQEKLQQIQTLKIDLEVRDITTREDWFQKYEYEIPILSLVETSGTSDEAPEVRLPRLSPRCTVAQLEQMLQKYKVTESQ